MSYNEETTPLQEEPLVLYLEDGAVIISEENYMQTGPGDYIVGEHSGDYVITQRTPGTPLESSIQIIAAPESSIHVTLQDVFIDTSSAGTAAVSVMGGAQTALTLEGTNRVVSGADSAGIMTGGNEETELILRGGGSLEARGGEHGAGIGGALDGAVGTIRIESGTISAYGGRGAAGIGGGDAAAAGTSGVGDAGTIVISGGTVYGEGTENPEETGEAYGAAGIGGGYSGGGTIRILGGDVTAVGAAKAACIGGSAASRITISGGTVRTRRKPGDGVTDAHEIGGYQDAYFGPSASLSSGEAGRAVIYVSGPDRISGWSALRETWNGVVWEGDAGVVYGAVDLSESGLTIASGQTLEVPGDPGPAAEPALTVTESGFRNNGTITGTGLVMMDGEKYRIEDNRLVPLTPDLPEIGIVITGDPSKIYDGTAATLPESGCTVTGGGVLPVSIFYKAKAAPDSAYTAAAPVNAGEYVVKAVCGGASAEKAFTIFQAAPAEAVIRVSVPYVGGEKGTADLSAAAAPYLLPEDAPAYTLGPLPESAYLPEDAVGLEGDTLTFTLASGAEAPGGETVVCIPVTVSGFTNYRPLALTVCVTVVPGPVQEGGGGFPAPPEPPRWERPAGNGGGQSPAVSGQTPAAAEETRPYGSKVVRAASEDGSVFTTVVSASGQSDTAVELSAAAVGREIVTLPIPALLPARDAALASSVTIGGPENMSVTVEIPVQDVSPGTVAVAVHAGGGREVLRQTVPTEKGLVITVPTGVTVQIIENGKAFADVPPEHWAGGAAAFVTGRELFAGTAADAFSPDREMTRGMLMTVLARLDGEDTAGGRSWYEKGVAWALARGVSSGDAPGQAVTCEEMVTMLYRYAGSPTPAESLAGFPTDAFSVSDYAAGAMDWAAQQGLLADADGALMIPKSGVTRAQAAVLLMRFVCRAL